MLATNQVDVGESVSKSPGVHLVNGNEFMNLNKITPISALFLSAQAPQQIEINIGDAWKTIEGAQVNIGDAWKEVF